MNDALMRAPLDDIIVERGATRFPIDVGRADARCMIGEVDESKVDAEACAPRSVSERPMEMRCGEKKDIARACGEAKLASRVDRLRCRRIDRVGRVRVRSAGKPLKPDGAAEDV